MKRNHLIPAAVMLLSLVTACAPADDVETEDTTPQATELAPPAAAVPAELEAAGDRFTAAWNGEDAAAVAAFFTDNASVTVDTSAYNGRMEIQERWVQPGLPMISDLEIQDQTWEPVGEDFRSEGRFTHAASTPDGDISVTGQYENVWTRAADGQWRISSMRVTSDPQAPTGT
jgi:ketosteroid isomerase-like protein